MAESIQDYISRMHDGVKNRFAKTNGKSAQHVNLMVKDGHVVEGDVVYAKSKQQFIIVKGQLYLKSFDLKK